MILFTFSDWRTEAVHHFRRTQRAETGSEALRRLCLLLPYRLVRHARLLIWKINKDLLLVLLLCHIPSYWLFGSPLHILKLPQILW